MKKGITVHTENTQLLKPVGPPQGRAEQPRKPKRRSTIYRKPPKAATFDFSCDHPQSVLSDEDVRNYRERNQ